MRKMIGHLLLITSLLLSSFAYSGSNDRCIDGSVPEVLNELMDATLAVGGNGELLKLAVSKTTKDMATAGGKVADDVDFTKRSIKLSDNRIEDGSHNFREGVAGARIELQDGITLRRAKTKEEEGIDFFDASTGEPISLKGPLFKNDMSPIPEAGRSVTAFAESAFKINTGVDKVYIDLFGLSADEIVLVKQYIADNLSAKGAGKTFLFVE